MKNILKKAMVAGATVLGSATSALAYTATYEPSDMADVAVDVVGEGGVQLKTYMPLMILFLVVGMVGTMWINAKRRFR